MQRTDVVKVLSMFFIFSNVATKALAFVHPKLTATVLNAATTRMKLQTRTI